MDRLRMRGLRLLVLIARREDKKIPFIPAHIKNPRLIVMYRGINAAMSFPALAMVSLCFSQEGEVPIRN